MTKPEQDIPTLTKVIQAGDESMAKHYDGHYVDQQDKPETNISLPADLQQQVEQVVEEALQEALSAFEQLLRRQLTHQICQKLTAESGD